MAVVTPIEADAEGHRRYRLSSPATLEAIDELVCATDDDVAAAVDRARLAQPGWAALTPADARAGYLRRWRWPIWSTTWTTWSPRSLANPASHAKRH